MKPGSIPTHRIELRIRQLAQLFNSMNPTPFRNRDLDTEAEAFIESRAQEFSPGGRFHITIHLEEPEKETNPNAPTREAIHNFSRYKAELTRHQLNQLLRHGRVSLAIGFSFMPMCLLAAHAVSELATGPSCAKA